MDSPDLPLPDSRPLLERLLRHVDECLQAADDHLCIAEQRKNRYEGMIDRCKRGIQDHPWDRLPMPQYKDWPYPVFPDELSSFVPLVEFDFRSALRELLIAVAKLEAFVGKPEYTVDEVVQYRECEAQRIEALRRVLVPYRVLRLRILDKLGQIDGTVRRQDNGADGISQSAGPGRRSTEERDMSDESQRRFIRIDGQVEWFEAEEVVQLWEEGFGRSPNPYGGWWQCLIRLRGRQGEWLLYHYELPEQTTLAEGAYVTPQDALNWLVDNGQDPPHYLLAQVKHGVSVSEVVKAQEMGCFLEWVERNPGKGALVTFEQTERTIVWDYTDGYPTAYTVAQLFKYPNDRYVLEEHTCHAEVGVMGDEQYREVSETEAARWIIRNRVPASVEYLSWAKRIVDAAGPGPDAERSLEEVASDSDRCARQPAETEASDTPATTNNSTTCYVTLRRAAALVSKSKKTVQRYVDDGRLPPPDIPGGQGKAAEWDWNKLRVPLGEIFNRSLPEKFPGGSVC